MAYDPPKMPEPAPCNCEQALTLRSRVSVFAALLRRCRDEIGGLAPMTAGRTHLLLAVDAALAVTDGAPAVQADAALHARVAELEALLREAHAIALHAGRFEVCPNRPCRALGVDAAIAVTDAPAGPRQDFYHRDGTPCDATKAACGPHYVTPPSRAPAAQPVTELRVGDEVECKASEQFKGPPWIRAKLTKVGPCGFEAESSEWDVSFACSLADEGVTWRRAPAKVEAGLSDCAGCGEPMGDLGSVVDVRGRRAFHAACAPAQAEAAPRVCSCGCGYVDHQMTLGRDAGGPCLRCGQCDEFTPAPAPASEPAPASQTCTEGCAAYPLCSHASLPPAPASEPAPSVQVKGVPRQRSFLSQAIRPFVFECRCGASVELSRVDEHAKTCLGVPASPPAPAPAADALKECVHGSAIGGPCARCDAYFRSIGVPLPASPPAAEGTQGEYHIQGNPPPEVERALVSVIKAAYPQAQDDESWISRLSNSERAVALRKRAGDAEEAQGPRYCECGAKTSPRLDCVTCGLPVGDGEYYERLVSAVAIAATERDALASQVRALEKRIAEHEKDWKVAEADADDAVAGFEKAYRELREERDRLAAELRLANQACEAAGASMDAEHAQLVEARAELAATTASLDAHLAAHDETCSQLAAALQRAETAERERDAARVRLGDSANALHRSGLPGHAGHFEGCTHSQCERARAALAPQVSGAKEGDRG